MHAMSAALYRFADLPADYPMPLIQRRRVIGDRMMISQVELDAGFAVLSHHHDNEQIVVMLSGHCRFGIGEEGTDRHQIIDVRGGDVLHLPANLPHSCTAIEPSLILDLFSPVSE